MTPQELHEENARLRRALEEIARRTLQADLNRLAHEALGHVHNPTTVRLMAEVERDWAERRWSA